MNTHIKVSKSAQRAPTFGKSAVGNTEHFDVVVVGAGISGVGGAYHLAKQCSGTSFVILETQESFGGTWLTHRYPGIRSDSDLYTFGYRFKPWIGAPIATAAEILAYMGEVIEENDLGRHIRYRHKINSAHWSSSELAIAASDIARAEMSSSNHRWARAIALSSAASGLRGGAYAPPIMSRISTPRRFIRITKKLRNR
jgi:monoamine oxidase